MTSCIIDQPRNCGFDPRSLIGTKVDCNGTTLTITATDADVVSKIWAVRSRFPDLDPVLPQAEPET